MSHRTRYSIRFHSGRVIFLDNYLFSRIVYFLFYFIHFERSYKERIEKNEFECSVPHLRRAEEYPKCPTATAVGKAVRHGIRPGRHGSFHCTVWPP